MPEWFQTRVKYLKQMPNGLIQRVSEQYLVNAMSFTEAEARIITEVQGGQREITMASISKSNITEVVFYGDTERWHKCKVTYVVTDEEAEKEKKVTTYLLVNAEDVKEAYDRVQEHLKDMLVPFQVPKIEESPFVEVFGFQAGFRAGLRRATPEDYEDAPKEEDSMEFKPATSPASGYGEEEENPFSEMEDEMSGDAKATDSEEEISGDFKVKDSEE